MKIFLEDCCEIGEFSSDIDLGLNREVYLNIKTSTPIDLEHVLALNEIVTLPIFNVMINDVVRATEKKDVIFSPMNVSFEVGDRLNVDLAVTSCVKVDEPTEVYVIESTMEMEKIVCSFCQSEEQGQPKQVYPMGDHAKVIKCLNNGKWNGKVILQTLGEDKWVEGTAIKLKYCPFCGEEIL